MATQNTGTRAQQNMENLLSQTARTLSSNEDTKALFLAGRRRSVEAARLSNVVYRVDGELEYIENEGKNESFFAFYGEVNANPLDGRRTHVDGWTMPAVIVVPVRSQSFSKELNERNTNWKDLVQSNLSAIQEGCRIVVADAAYVEQRAVSPTDRKDILYIVASGFFGDDLCISMLDVPMPAKDEAPAESPAASAATPIDEPEDDPTI